MQRCLLLVPVALAALAAGCSLYAQCYLDAAERDIQQILDANRYQAVGKLQEEAKFPKPEPKPEPAPKDKPPAAGAKEAPKPRVLSVQEALRVATHNNRDFRSQIETLQLAALSVSLQERNFGPILSNTISYVFANSPSTAATGTAAASVGVSQVLPTGGGVSASTGLSAVDDLEAGGSTTYRHDVTVSFSQPLLRGFGREVAWEALTQAQRDVIYALRDFELFRQDFSIDVLSSYYGILRQKQVVENSRRTYERFVFLRRRSEALFEIGRVSAIDKFRAKQEELTASNNLITEEETLASLLDSFRVFLGLPEGVRIDVEDVKPTAKQADIDLDSAVAAALHNRLDLRTAEERLEDADRGVRIARNGLLPDLDLDATFGLDGVRGAGWPNQYEGSQSVGLSLVLPLDKVPDRNTYKRSLITRSRRRRTLDLTRDNIRVGVMNTYRRLRRLANSVQIQQANVDLAEKRVQNAQVLFEAGELGNRDVVEAESAKLSAQNALIRAILDYEIARLQLKRDIGILFIGPDGMWKE